jgi:pyridoxal phosphate enzyme (YggS family)
MINAQAWQDLQDYLNPADVSLVAVSKIKPVEDIAALYALGQRDFGENYVQELVSKVPHLPEDVRWHFIGHLQRNKVKQIAPFVHLIHGVDSLRLLTEINAQAAKLSRTIDVLLQMFIASEETKFGMDEKELVECLEYVTAPGSQLQHIRVRGLMGMASATDDEARIRREFTHLSDTHKSLRTGFMTGRPYFDTISMGMSGDYRIAVECGSTMVRIGSLLFGKRS